MLDKSENCGIIYLVPYAGIAHPVERHLAKVEVASSSLVARSKSKHLMMLAFSFINAEISITMIITPEFH